MKKRTIKKRRKPRTLQLDESIKRLFPPVSPMGPGYPVPWSRPDVEKQGKSKSRVRLRGRAFSS